MVNNLPWMHNKKIVEETKPAFYFDGTQDFSQWQRTAREKLCALLGLDKIQKPEDDHFTIEYTKECEDFTEIRFTIESEKGYAFLLGDADSPGHPNTCAGDALQCRYSLGVIPMYFLNTFEK